jgi:hypothetical protein
MKFCTPKKNTPKNKTYYGKLLKQYLLPESDSLSLLPVKENNHICAFDKTLVSKTSSAIESTTPIKPQKSYDMRGTD